MRKKKARRTVADRAVSSLAWWTPELVAAAVLAMIAAVVTVVAPIALTLAGLAVGRVLLAPIVWRVRHRIRRQRVLDALSRRDRRAAARRRAVEQGTASGSDNDGRGAA